MARHGPSARLLAGGTDLLVDLKVSRIATGHLVSLGRIEELRSIDVTSEGVSIGAMATLTALNETPLPHEFAAIKDATSAMAAPHIRNMATVGGNLAGAVPCADLPPVLMVMDANVDLVSARGARSTPVRGLFTAPRRTVLDHDEILVRIRVPAPPARFGAAYARFSLRNGNSIAVAAVGASLVLDASGTIRDARLSLGAVAPTPLLVDEVTTMLTGRPLDDATIADAAEAAMRAARPIDDIRGSAEYRRHLCGVLAGRALRTAAGRIGD